MSKLIETSLSRVWRQFSDPDQWVALLTAFRGENTLDANLSRNRSLAAEIRAKGYGYFFVDGYWVENAGTPDEVHVNEDSIFVNGTTNDEQQFIKTITALGNKYSQEAVLIKTSAGTKLYFKNGDVQDIGSISPGKLGQAYTKLRNNKVSNTFVFESERDAVGYIQHLAGIQSK